MNKNDFFNKMNNPNIYMHVTEDLNHNGHFVPRIPLSKLISEDNKTPRVCVAENLKGCLLGADISKNTLIKVFFVDIEKLNLTNHIVKWRELFSNNLVLDSIVTKEAWILKEFKIRKEDTVIISIDNLKVEYDFLFDDSIIPCLKLNNDDFTILKKTTYE